MPTQSTCSAPSFREERIHVCAILGERIFVGIAQPAASATPDEIGTYHASPRCRQIGSEIVKISALTAQPMNAHDRNCRMQWPPVHVSKLVKAGQRKAADSSGPIRLGAGLGD